MKKTCFEILNDGIYSTIEEVSIYGTMGVKNIDNIVYFSTKEKAKKSLIKDFKNRILDYQFAIKRIKSII